MRGKQSAINNETSVRVRRLGHHFSNFKFSFFYLNLRLDIKNHTHKNPFSCVEFAVTEITTLTFSFENHN